MIGLGNKYIGKWALSRIAEATLNLPERNRSPRDTRADTKWPDSAWNTVTVTQQLRCLLSTTVALSPQLLGQGRWPSCRKCHCVLRSITHKDSLFGITFLRKVVFGILSILPLPFKFFPELVISVLNLTLPDLPSVCKLLENSAVTLGAHFRVIASPCVSEGAWCTEKKNTVGLRRSYCYNNWTWGKSLLRTSDF